MGHVWVQLGAVVTMLVEEDTTHVVAAAKATDKVHWAVAHDRHVVSPAWLQASGDLSHAWQGFIKKIGYLAKPDAIGHTCRASAATSAGPTVVYSLSRIHPHRISNMHANGPEHPHECVCM